MLRIAEVWTMNFGLYGLQIYSGLFYFVQTKASDAAKKKKWTDML